MPSKRKVTPEQEAEAAENAARKTALRKAYGQATQDLREAHKDEFGDLYSVRAKEAGYDWHPRLSPEQKAEEEFARLIEEFPFLRDRLTEQAPPEDEDPVEP